MNKHANELEREHVERKKKNEKQKHTGNWYRNGNGNVNSKAVMMVIIVSHFIPPLNLIIGLKEHFSWFVMNESI